MKHLASILIFVSLCIHTQVCSQNPNPGADIIYNPHVVAVIEVTMDTADKAFMLHDDNKWSDEYMSASLRFRNDQIDTFIEGAGIRLRGNTSRNHPKKSLKLKFKEFGGKKFYGYKKFNLKAENNDPTFLREHYTLQTYREAGLAAARSHHAEVYINGEYMGLYLNVEQLDDEFTVSRFGNDTGNLYKCLWGSSLEDDGQYADDLIYELKNNETINDRSKLLNFIKVLNHASDDSFSTQISRWVDMDKLIRFLAVEIVVGHWDGYSYNKNNFYIYENPATGKMEFIPYDVDNTFGMDWVGKDWAKRDVMKWAYDQNTRPLINRIMDNYGLRYQLGEQLKYVLDSVFTTQILFPQFESSKSLLMNSVKADTYYPKTFGFSISDFSDGHTQRVVNHAPYGLRPYMEERISSARTQLAFLSVPISTSYHEKILIYPNPSSGYAITIDGDVVGDVKVTSVTGQNIPFDSTSFTNNQLELRFTRHISSGLYIIQTSTWQSTFVVH